MRWHMMIIVMVDSVGRVAIHVAHRVIVIGIFVLRFIITEFNQIG